MDAIADTIVCHGTPVLNLQRMSNRMLLRGHQMMRTVCSFLIYTSCSPFFKFKPLPLFTDSSCTVSNTLSSIHIR